MSTVVSSTSATAQNWAVPSNLVAGDKIRVEGWGAGSGGSGGNTSNRSGGAGGAYAVTTYQVTPNDTSTTNITFTLTAGGAGSASANSTLGADTTWSASNVNLISDCINTGASGTTLPTNWSTHSVWGVTVSCVGSGRDSSGYPYVDINFTTGAGTTTSAASASVYMDNDFATTASTAYTLSCRAAVIAGSLTNITSVQGGFDQWTAGPVYLNFNTVTFSPTVSSSVQTVSASFTTSVGVTEMGPSFCIQFNNGVAIEATFRIGAVQVEAAAAATFWKSTPGFLRAKGGSATSGTTGGVGGQASACIPTTGAFNGGSGATRVQGGGGGGSAGKDGAGGSSTTGTGATGDNGSGGAANTANVEGGGGGTAGNPANAGGAPGGGGGANTSTSAGLAGGRGQLRLQPQLLISGTAVGAGSLVADGTVVSTTAARIPFIRWPQLLPIMAQ